MTTYLPYLILAAIIGGNFGVWLKDLSAGVFMFSLILCINMWVHIK
jgi:hypothetical protein